MFFDLDNNEDRKKLGIDPKPLPVPEIIFGEKMIIKGREVCFELAWNGAYHELWYEDEETASHAMIFGEDIKSKRCERIVGVSRIEYNPGKYFRLFATLAETNDFVGEIKGVDFTRTETIKKMHKINPDAPVQKSAKIGGSAPRKTRVRSEVTGDWSRKKVEIDYCNSMFISMSAYKAHYYLRQKKFKDYYYQLLNPVTGEFIDKNLSPNQVTEEDLVICQKNNYRIKIIKK